jgi:hypothetical protein
MKFSLLISHEDCQFGKISKVKIIGPSGQGCILKGYQKYGAI